MFCSIIIFKYWLYVLLRMTNHTIKRWNIKLTLSINKEVLKAYKKFCKENGLIISKQLENFMRIQLKKK